MTENWEDELATLLSDLSAVQDDLLATLSQKRDALGASDIDRITAIGRQEQDLVERLTQCQQRRASLLARAADEGLPADNIRELAGALPAERKPEVKHQIDEVRSRSRLLQHHSLTNWVLVQRTLLHLSQLLEIIATGGRQQPTYEKSGNSKVGGSLVDQEA